MPRQPSDVELAYLAGIVDADGFVCIGRSAKVQRVYFTALIGITGSKRQPHELAAEVFGGKVNVAGAHGVQFGWYWQRGGTRAAPIIEALYPYLRIKRPQADLALAVQALTAEMYTAEVGQEMAALRDQCKRLNVRRGGRRPGRTKGFVDEELAVAA